MQEQTTAREVPAWVFVAVIVLCLVGGGTFVYYWFSGASPLGAEIKLKEGVDLTQERGRPRQAPPQRRGPIQLQQGDDNQRVYLVRSGRNQQMTVTDRKSGEKTFEVRLRRAFVGDAWQLAQAATRIAADNQVARTLNVTEEQRQKLRDLNLGEALLQGAVAELTKEEIDRLTAAWNEADLWNKPATRESEQKITEALDAVASSSLIRTREAVTQQTRKVRDILTPEQIRAFNQMDREQSAEQSPRQPSNQAPQAQPSQSRQRPEGFRGAGGGNRQRPTTRPSGPNR